MLIFENNGSEDAEYSEDADDDKKSVNFNSQLTKIKSVQLSPQLCPPRPTDSEEMSSPTQHSSPRLRRRSKLSPSDQVQVLKTPEPELLGVAEAARDISSSLVDSKFRRRRR